MNVSSDDKEGMVAVRGAEGASEEIVVVLVEPRTIWFVVDCDKSAPDIVRSPVLLSVNRVVPEADAVKIF